MGLLNFLLKLPTMPEPSATLNFIVSIPAVPFMLPYFIGINLLQTSAREKQASIAPRK